MNDFAPARRRALRDAGCRFERHGKGDHELWYSPITRRSDQVISRPVAPPAAPLHRGLGNAVGAGDGGRGDHLAYPFQLLSPVCNCITRLADCSLCRIARFRNVPAGSAMQPIQPSALNDRVRRLFDRAVARCSVFCGLVVVKRRHVGLRRGHHGARDGRYAFRLGQALPSTGS